MSEEAVKVIHMISGPPVIAKVNVKSNKRNNGDIFELEDPLTMVYAPDTDLEDPEASPKFTVRELLVLAEKSTIEVDSRNVLFSYIPIAEIIEQYNAVMVNKLTKVNS